MKGDLSLKDLFNNLIKERIPECEQINIKLKERKETVLIQWEDDGNQLPEKIKQDSTMLYTGKTTGTGGFRYYLIKEIAKNNKAKIKIRNSELGGTKFDITLKKP